MMFRQSPRRQQRNKGMRVKHVVQMCVLLGACIWLLFYQYQMDHHSSSQHGINLSKKLSDASDIKFGRKDLKPKAAAGETQDEEKQNEGRQPEGSQPQEAEPEHGGASSDAKKERPKLSKHNVGEQEAQVNMEQDGNKNRSKSKNSQDKEEENKTDGDENAEKHEKKSAGKHESEENEHNSNAKNDNKSKEKDAKEEKKTEEEKESKKKEREVKNESKKKERNEKNESKEKESKKKETTGKNESKEKETKDKKDVAEEKNISEKKGEEASKAGAMKENHGTESEISPNSQQTKAPSNGLDYDSSPTAEPADDQKHKMHTTKKISSSSNENSDKGSSTEAQMDLDTLP